MEQDKSSLDAEWKFPSEFNKDSRSVRMVSGAENIGESLGVLLATKPKERVMPPAYGCDPESLVFENIDSSALTLIRDTVKRAVLLFEPRIDLENIEIDEERANEGILYIKLTYTVRATNRKSSLVYPFYFLEGKT